MTMSTFAAGVLAGCSPMGGGITAVDGSWRPAIHHAAAISNPTGPRPDGGEQVAAKLVGPEVNLIEDCADVVLERVAADGMCFSVSAFQRQAEDIKAYDLMIVARGDKRTVSQFSPFASNGRVAVHRRWTKPLRNEFNAPAGQAPYVDYSVCFDRAIALGPDTRQIILRGTDAQNQHAFAIFEISDMGG